MNAHDQEEAQVEKRADHFNFKDHYANQSKVTYILRINECTWSGVTASGKESRPL